MRAGMRSCASNRVLGGAKRRLVAALAEAHKPKRQDQGQNKTHHIFTFRNADRASGVALRSVFTQNALVSFQLPLMIRAIGKPLGYSALGVYLARSHGDARLLTVGDNFLQAQRTVAENSDKCDKHGDLGLKNVIQRLQNDYCLQLT
jgi:hypothetical protein